MIPRSLLFTASSIAPDPKSERATSDLTDSIVLDTPLPMSDLATSDLTDSIVLETPCLMSVTLGTLGVSTFIVGVTLLTALVTFFTGFPPPPPPPP